MSTAYELESPPSDIISALRFSPSDLKLLVSSWDRDLYIYHREDNASASFTYRQQVQCDAPVLDVCWGADDNTIFAVGLDYTVRHVDLSTAEPKQRVLSSHGQASNKIAFSPEHNVLLSTSWDSTVHVHIPDETGSFVRLASPAKPFALALTSKFAVVAMAERKVSVFDLSALKQLVEQTGSTMDRQEILEVQPWQTRESSLKFMTRAVACMPDGTGFATSSIEGRVGVEWFEPELQGKTYAFKCHRQTTTTATINDETGDQSEEPVDLVYPVNALAFHPVHGTFATGGGDGVVCFWDAQSKRRVKQYPKLGASVAAMDFSSDGKLLAVGFSPGFEDGKEPDVEEEGSVKVIIRELGEDEAKPRAAKTK